MTDVNADLVAELVSSGLDRREARWLVEEFVPGGDLDAAPALRRAAKRRLEGEPLQYIIGHWPFRSLDLDVDPSVLIPRPETEELVGIAIDELARMGCAAPVIMDLGCGSGAIGLALLEELLERGIFATLVAVDQSANALIVARRNALKHKLHAVSFVRSSWFDEVDTSLRGHVDLIVANPPYVSEEEFKVLDPVLHYEPRSAIVSRDAKGVAGFADLDQIIREAISWLGPNGTLICEHSNIHRDAAMKAAASAGFVNVHDVDDLAGHARTLIARTT